MHIIKRLTKLNRSHKSDHTHSSFSSPTAEVLSKHYPSTERGTLYVLLLLLIVIAIFISTTKLERVVTTTGRLVPINGPLTVQPLQTQIISHINVHVGDIVKKGDVLATCDPTFAEADRVHLEQQLASLNAQISRMTAEDKDEAFKPDNTKPYDALQYQIFAERQTGLRAGIGDYDQRIHSAEAQLSGLQQSVIDYKSRLKIVGEMEGMHSSLAKDGYVSRLQWLNVQDQQADLNQKRADAESTLSSTRHLLESLREQRKVFVDKWRDDNLNALVAARNNQDEAQQQLLKADKTRELVNLVAPDDAIVTRTPALAAGGVATGAQLLFSLIPIRGGIEAQVQIDSQDIGFVKTGDPVTIKVDAYKFLEHGAGKGTVKSVSQDAFSDSGTQSLNTPNDAGMQGHPAFFDARVTVLDMNLHDVPRDFRLIPGMTVTADIIVGHRTILWYLIGGGLRSGADALREP